MKYSIPENYEVKHEGILYGIMRRGVKNEWIWQMKYRAIMCAKTYGKILIAYKDIDDMEPGLTVCTYNGKYKLPVKVYDVLFGEDCLYVKLNSNGKLAWCLVNEELTGVAPIGDFGIIDEDIGREQGVIPNFMDRDWEQKWHFHIPIGKKKVVVNAGQEKRNLILSSGKLDDTARKKKAQEVKYYGYKIGFDTNSGTVLFSAVDSNNRSTLEKTSKCIGELEVTKDIIKAIAGGEFVPMEVGTLMCDVINKFENGMFGGFLMVPFLRAKDELKKSGKEAIKHEDILKAMIKEISEGWYKDTKVYVSAQVLFVLIKKGDVIHIGTENIYDSEEFEPMDSEILSSIADETHMKLQVIDVKDKEVVTEPEETSNMPLPYYVRQKESLDSSIDKYRYEKVTSKTVVVKVGDRVVNIPVAFSEKFIYTTKNKNEAEIRTNTNTVTILNM